MDQQQDHSRVIGRPFPKGTSGHPQGGGLSRKKRRMDVMAQLAADMGGGLERLSEGDRILLARAVDLLMSRPSSPNDRVRLTNAATRILSGIRRRQPPRKPVLPPSPSLSSLIRQARSP
jgi:hypothetical protein